MSLRPTVAIAWFFAKTMYLSPFNNPLFYLLLILGGIFFFSGSLGKHEATLLLLLAGITNRLMPTCRAAKSGTGELESDDFSRYSSLWPVGKGDFFCGFQLTSLAFILLLILPCLYAGKQSEMPPMVLSMCPPKTCFAHAPSGEPVVTVEEVIITPDSVLNLRPVQLTIPVYHSLLFGFLAKEVLVGREKISDGLFNELCPVPPSVVSPDDIFDSGKGRRSPAWYFSDFLGRLPELHFKRLLYITCFVFLFFWMDGIAKFEHGKRGAFGRVVLGVKHLYNAGYLLLCCLLVIDVLLPESMLAKMSLSAERLGAIPRIGSLAALGAGMLWIFAHFYSRRPTI